MDQTHGSRWGQISIKRSKQWITRWSGLLGRTSSRGKLCLLSYHSCQKYGTWKSIYIGGDFNIISGGQATKGWDHFHGESWPLKASCKDFNLAISGGLGWMKWLKNGTGKDFIFHTITLALYHFWWKFYWLS